MKRFSFVLAAVAALVVVPASRSVAATDPGLVAPVDRLVRAILANDGRRIAAAYVPSPAIVDEFAPFSWTGAGAPAAWVRDFTAMTRAEAITAARVTHGPPQTATVSGDGRRAYLVVPTTFAYELHGKPTTEQGTWTFVLVRAGTGDPWRIATSAWGTTRMVTR